MLPPPPPKEPSSSAASPGGWRQVRGPSRPPHPEGWGAWWPVLSASCCVHTPTSHAAFSGESGGRAKAPGGKSLPWGCLGWRPNQECADTPPGSGGLLGK